MRKSSPLSKKTRRVISLFVLLSQTASASDVTIGPGSGGYITHTHSLGVSVLQSPATLNTEGIYDVGIYASKFSGGSFVVESLPNTKKMSVKLFIDNKSDGKLVDYTINLPGVGVPRLSTLSPSPEDAPDASDVLLVSSFVGKINADLSGYKGTLDNGGSVSDICADKILSGEFGDSVRSSYQDRRQKNPSLSKKCDSVDVAAITEYSTPICSQGKFDSSKNGQIVPKFNFNQAIKKRQCYKAPSTLLKRKCSYKELVNLTGSGTYTFPSDVEKFDLKIIGGSTFNASNFKDLNANLNYYFSSGRKIKDLSPSDFNQSAEGSFSADYQLGFITFFPTEYGVPGMYDYVNYDRATNILFVDKFRAFKNTIFGKFSAPSDARPASTLAIWGNMSNGVVGGVSSGKSGKYEDPDINNGEPVTNTTQSELINLDMTHSKEIDFNQLCSDIYPNINITNVSESFKSYPISADTIYTGLSDSCPAQYVNFGPTTKWATSTSEFMSNYGFEVKTCDFGSNCGDDVSTKYTSSSQNGQIIQPTAGARGSFGGRIDVVAYQADANNVSANIDNGINGKNGSIDITEYRSPKYCADIKDSTGELRLNPIINIERVSYFPFEMKPLGYIESQSFPNRNKADFIKVYTNVSEPFRDFLKSCLVYKGTDCPVEAKNNP